MRPVLRLSNILLLLGTAVTGFGYFMWIRPMNLNQPVAAKVRPAAMIDAHKARDEKLQAISSNIKAFSLAKGYNPRIAFLVDMSIPSGRNRFFVYNMQKDSIEIAGLVTHGYGSPNAGIEFSNIPGSYCSSLGKYKVGKSYEGRFGLAFKLHGLDKTNDKAFERFVVLHAHECVPVKEIEPLTICESQGCPTVAPGFLQKLKSYIEISDQPILLNIYQ